MAKKTTVKKRTARASRKPAAAGKKAARKSARRAVKKSPAAKKAGARKARGTRAVPPPKGWVELDVFERPREPAEPTLEEQLEEFVRDQVIAGYFSDATIIRLAAQMYDDLGPTAKLRKLARPMVAAARAAHRREQKSWPAITDNMRLDRAFADLEKHGIIARQNFWCCGTCGGEAIVDEVARANKRGGKGGNTFDGYTYFHEQDTNIAVFGHGLSLGYGTPDFEPKESVAIGLLVVKALRQQGLRPEWSGDLEDHIHVPMKWQRKFTKQVKYTPD